MRIALIGGETLLGKELEDVLGRRTSKVDIHSFAASGEGNFSEAEGEAIYLEPLSEKTIQESRAVLIAGSADGAKKAYDLVKAASPRPLLIDCTSHLENAPEARIVAPLAVDVAIERSWLLSVAHPAATALVLTLKRLARYQKLRQVIAHVFEPASEQGRRGIGELGQQTTGLLAFKSLEKQVFDAQLSFNMLPRYGAEALANLLTVENRIESQIATVLSSQRLIESMPLPSLRVLAAPVFHGYSISIWAEFENNIDPEEIGETLASAQIEVRGAGDEVPSNVGATGQSGLIAGDIRRDSNNPRAAWMWVAADNLRLTAEAAADLISKVEAGENDG